MDKIHSEIADHAISQFPFECVGYVSKGKYFKLENISSNPESRYSLSLEDKFMLMGLGENLDFLVHSHPSNINEPSNMDIAAHNSTGYNFMIIGTNGKTTTQIRELIYERSGNT